MGWLMGLIGELKLSLLQWITVSLAALVGVLLVVLKARGTALHKVQTQLLAARLHAAQASKDADVRAAQAAYAKALKAYKDLQ